MSTATMHERPLRAVYGPQDVEDVREHLDQQRGAFRAFLKSKGVLAGLLRTIRDHAASVWGRLSNNRFLLYASRTLGWTLHGARQVGHVLSRPGVRSGLLWTALTETGGKVIRTVASTVAGMARQVLRPLAKVGGWLLRLTGRSGARVADKLEQVVDAVGIPGQAGRR